MVEIIFISPFFLNYILPFVLVFTLIFAILEKTQLLGEGKKQVDALIGLVVGLILIAFPFPRTIVVELMPFLAVAAVILLVFMLLYGFIVGKQEKGMHISIKVTFVIILAVALLTVFLIIAGWWDLVYNFLFEREAGAQIVINVILIAIIVGAIVAVIKGAGKEK